MIRRLTCLSLAPALAPALVLAIACSAEEPIDDAPASDDLENGLKDLGKADAATSGITVSRRSISLRGAAARTLYNLLDDAGAASQTAGGLRLVVGPATGCITNGERTFCQIIGLAEATDGAYEALTHGRDGRSAASYLHSLIADSTGSDDAFVSVPWLACERAGGAVWCGVESSEPLELHLDNVEDLGDDFVYEGWAVAGGVPTTTDRFRAADGAIFQRVPASVASQSPVFVLTIEPRRGDDSSPAATHFVAGALALGAAADLTTSHGAALGTDFADADGGFILATPSSASTDDNENGVWYVNPAAGEPSLSLPTLPAGWAYEGWVVTGDGPISTGRFVDVAGADSDGGGPSAGPEATPPFPGQDFVNPPLSLVGAAIVISVEPDPDNGAGPFSLKPLINPSASDVTAPTLQLLDNKSQDSLASGQAILGN